ncbi:MAG: hypothetical protein KDE47_15205 [Caldilineaceae bacterium]|nr:hypothetical protein [Caldilineaceae bacterium]
MIELETERLLLRKGRTTPPTHAELEADYHRYVTGFAEPDVTFAQYIENSTISGAGQSIHLVLVMDMVNLLYVVEQDLLPVVRDVARQVATP